MANIINIKALQSLAAKAASDCEIDALLEQLPLPQIVEFFDGFEDLFINSSCRNLARKARRSKRHNELSNARKSLFNHLEATGLGGIYTNTPQTQYGFCHLSVEGVVRISMFDNKGFYGHADLANPEAISNAHITEELLDRGFKMPSPDQAILDKIFMAKTA